MWRLTTVLCRFIVSWRYWCTDYGISTPSRIGVWIVLPHWIQERHRWVIGYCARCNPCRCLRSLVLGSHKTRISRHHANKRQRRLFRHSSRVFPLYFGNVTVVAKLVRITMHSQLKHVELRWPKQRFCIKV